MKYIYNFKDFKEGIERLVLNILNEKYQFKRYDFDLMGRYCGMYYLTKDDDGAKKEIENRKLILEWKFAYLDKKEEAKKDFFEIPGCCYTILGYDYGMFYNEHEDTIDISSLAIRDSKLGFINKFLRGLKLKDKILSKEELMQYVDLFALNYKNNKKNERVSLVFPVKDISEVISEVVNEIEGEKYETKVMGLNFLYKYASMVIITKDKEQARKEILERAKRLLYKYKIEASLGDSTEEMFKIPADNYLCLGYNIDAFSYLPVEYIYLDKVNFDKFLYLKDFVQGLKDLKNDRPNLSLEQVREYASYFIKEYKSNNMSNVRIRRNKGE